MITFMALINNEIFALLDVGFLGRLFINFSGRNTIPKQQNPEDQVEKSNKRIVNSERMCSVLDCTSTEKNFVLHRPYSKAKLSAEKGELWYSKLIYKPKWATSDKRHLRVCSLHFIAGNYKFFLKKGKILKNL